MTIRREHLPVELLIAALALAWIVSVAALIWPHDGLRLGLRYFMYAICAAAAAAALGRRYRSLLISPLFLLGLSSTLFFSLAVWLLLHTGFDLSRVTWPDNRMAAERFLGGEGDLIVLQFSALCLLAAFALARFGPRMGYAPWEETPKSVPDAAAPKLMATGACAMLFCVGVLGSHYLPPAAAAWVTGGAGREMFHATVPLMAVGSILLIAAAADRSTGWTILAFGGLLAGCTVLLLTFAAKASVYLALAGLAYFITRGRLSLRSIAIVCAVASVIVVVLLIAASAIRTHQVRLMGLGVAEFSYRVVEAKLLLRQGETAGCFQNAVERSLPVGREESPFYFVTIFIPRVLWPDKPNFSLGNEYANTFCGSNLNPLHSSSITLLGQPIVRAGWAGLAVAQGCLISGLLGFTWIARRYRPLGPVALVALLPWLIDFDQDFALYVGNAVKMFLWMLPVLVVAGFIVKRRAAADSSP